MEDKKKSRFSNAPAEMKPIEFDLNLRPIERKKDQILYSIDHK